MSLCLPAKAWLLSDSSNLDDYRDSLITFWLSAPSDQIETLWSLQYGLATKSLVLKLSPSHIFTDSQIRLRTEIGEHLNNSGLKHPLSIQYMIANFLLSPPGLLVINNVNEFFPDWFAQEYNNLYEKDQVSDPVVNQQPTELPTESLSTPDFGPFPNSLNDLLSNRIHLNRILGLSNLYYIDPEDREITTDLLHVRRALANLIKDCPESDLERIWSTEFGDRYWALVRSGIQNESLADEDQRIKDEAVHRLNPDHNGGFGTKGALNYFLVSMMYFLPGTMTVDQPANKIPQWLLTNYIQIFDLSSVS